MPHDDQTKRLIRRITDWLYKSATPAQIVALWRHINQLGR